MTTAVATKITDTETIRPIVAKHVMKAYSGFLTVGASQIDRMTELLTNSPADEDDAKENAEKVRWVLWSSIGGGGVSASVTNAIYTELGRFNETHETW